MKTPTPTPFTPDALVGRYIALTQGELVMLQDHDGTRRLWIFDSPENASEVLEHFGFNGALIEAQHLETMNDVARAIYSADKCAGGPAGLAFDAFVTPDGQLQCTVCGSSQMPAGGDA